MKASDDPDHGFGGAQRQQAVGLEQPGKALEDAGLGVLVEIDQDVAAENHVERSEMRKVLQQIQLPVLDHGADIGIELPQLSDLREMLDQHLDRQAALDLELAEDAGLGFFQHALRQIGRDDLDPPPASAAPNSFRHIAIEYGSCPVEEAAHQMRRERRLARACSSSGRIVCRR